MTYEEVKVALEFRLANMTPEERDVEIARQELANRRAYRVAYKDGECVRVDADPEAVQIEAENKMLRAEIRSLRAQQKGGRDE